MNQLRLAALAALVVLTALIAPSRAAEAERPNFLVILCDDLGYGDLACYGHETIRTPHLDKLAGEGIRLTACYSASPVCSASRAGLMTGRTPSRVGVYDWIPGGHQMHLRKSEITIATLLKKAGYATSHVGKWHLNGKFNSPQQPQPGDHGFDHWFATQNNANPSHENPQNFVRNGKPVGKLEGYSCQIVADEAIRWLTEERDKSKPFFQFVCFHEPHEPIASPPELVATYGEAKKKGEALYYANVTNMDAAVGKLMTALDEIKLRDDTFVFFTSDNGPETLNRYGGAWRSHGSPGPLRGMKLHLYEAGVRVPGILRWPGHAKPGVELDEPVCSLDLLPTFCRLAGVDPPQDRTLDGADMLAIFDGKPIERDTPLFWHYHRSIGKPKASLREGEFVVLGHWSGPMLGAGASLRDGDMELIKNSKLTSFELYNLEQDLGQKNNLADDPKSQQALQDISGKLKRKYQDVVEEGPSWPKR